MQEAHSCHFPDRDCPLCPRLAAFRTQNRVLWPDKFHAPVPAFGDLESRLLIVGLAPGLKGANFTGRPFTGDYAGVLLYETLLRFGFATGHYGAHAEDGLRLTDCRITNAVRCVPPENKPTNDEIRTCLPFLSREIAAMPRLQAILCLGLISHKAVLKVCHAKAAQNPFGHGHTHTLKSPESDKTLFVFDSYHCSRYNTQTNRLTQDMFCSVFQQIHSFLS